MNAKYNMKYKREVIRHRRIVLIYTEWDTKYSLIL